MRSRRSDHALLELALTGALLALGLRRRDPYPAADEKHADPSLAERLDEGRGREADTPLQIPAPGWKDILVRTYEQISLDRVLAVAAGVTFYALLAVFPAITALVSIYGFFADRATVIDHLGTLAGFLPSGAVEIIGEQMTRIAGQPADALGVGFAVGLAIALWSANQGMKAIFDALNIAYGETEKRGFFRLNAISLGFTLAAILFVLTAIAAIVVLPIALDYVGLARSTDTLIAFARWPLMLVAIVFVVSILYRYGPSRRKARWRWITPGSVLASLVWMAASIAFSWYVASFGSYNETYGSLGAVIGFMTWIWVSATIILVGAELNAEIEHQTARDSTVGRRRPLGRRGATMADTVGRSTAS